MVVRARSPLRISFGGGGTDVSPYLEERGGVVLSATIDKFCYATLIPSDTPEIHIESLDYGTVLTYGPDEPLRYDGKLDLVKAVVRRACTHRMSAGFKLFLHTDAPPGSGLGSSSALVVAVLGLFKHWLNQPMTDYEVANLAFLIERMDLGIAGGKQDHYASTFGGFNFIEFMKDVTVVNPLRIDPDTVDELHYRLLLCYTGTTRLGANIIATQVRSYVSRDQACVTALDRLKAIAYELKNALLQGRLDDFGALLHEGWESKKRLAPQVTDASIDALYEAARKEGALGGKILGAGGGGYLLVYCPFDRKHLVAREIERLGGRVVPFTFESAGLRTWRVGRDAGRDRDDPGAPGPR